MFTWEVTYVQGHFMFFSEIALSPLTLSLTPPPAPNIPFSGTPWKVYCLNAGLESSQLWYGHCLLQIFKRPREILCTQPTSLLKLLLTLFLKSALKHTEFFSVCESGTIWVILIYNINGRLPASALTSAENAIVKVYTKLQFSIDTCQMCTAENRVYPPLKTFAVFTDNKTENMRHRWKKWQPLPTLLKPNVKKENNDNKQICSHRPQLFP